MACKKVAPAFYRGFIFIVSDLQFQLEIHYCPAKISWTLYNYLWWRVWAPLRKERGWGEAIQAGKEFHNVSRIIMLEVIKTIFLQVVLFPAGGCK